MTKLLILGGTGLLGNAVTKYFANLAEDYDVTITYRNAEIAEKEFPDVHKVKFDAATGDLHTLQLKDFDYVINCIGVIKPYFKENLAPGINLNALFPWRLSKACNQQNAKLIHITTDCVYSGKDGKYAEDAPHDCLDAYGKTKSLGEPTNCMVIRTSIIGVEIHNDASLIAWAISQAGNEVNGYTHHHWNGMTTRQFADVCHQIIDCNLYQVGLSHLFSDSVSKYELLQLISDAFKLDLKITKYSDENSVDRTLSTTKTLINDVSIPSLYTQLKVIANA